MAKTCVGLDIGTSAIKVVQVSKSGTSLKIERAGVAPIPMGSIEAGKIVNIPIVAQEVTRVMRQQKIGAKQVMAAVAGEAVIHRIIRMPSLPRRELESAVKWESEKYIPFPIAEACTDFDVIQEIPETNEVEILLVAAQRNIIESHIAAMREAKLRVMAVDVQPLALSRALESSLSMAGPVSNVAILDVGAGTSDLAIFSNGVQRFIRIIPIGGNYFTNAIAKRLSISNADAETLKLTRGRVPLPDQPPESPEIEQLCAIISGIMVELVTEIRRSIDYYYLQNHEQVSRLITTGGGITLRNMDIYLARELGLNVEVADPLAQMRLAPSVQASQLANAGPIFSVAIGLGIRGVQEW